MTFYTENEDSSTGILPLNIGKNKSASGDIRRLIVGEAVAFGNLLYPKEDNKFYKAKADQTATMPALVMALDTRKANQECTSLFNGIVRNDSWTFVLPNKLYVSNNTAGSMVSSVFGTFGLYYKQYVGTVIRSNHIYFNPNLNYDFETTIVDNTKDVTALFERQTNTYTIPIWEEGQFPLLKAGKHLRLKVLDASVTVADNSEQEQSIEIVGITTALTIAPSYGAGVSIPLNIIRDTIGINEQIEVNATGNRRVTVKLICESNE